MAHRDRFLEFITVERLYTAAAIFGIVTVAMVSLIYVYLFLKKKRYFTRKKISSILEDWIGMALLEESDEAHTHMTPELIEYFTNTANRQYAMDLLIATRKNITGQAARNIIRIYEQLELQYDSIIKFRSSTWYIRARGIYELYMMNQREMIEEITSFTNDKDEFVRTEAQTATIAFEGFKGLAFLATLTHALNDWEQVKILEQLEALDPEDMPDLPVWIQSSNDYVVIFALKLAEIYYQLHAHDIIIGCLKHPNEKVRKQAIITLARLANISTPFLILSRYEQETFGNKRILLQQIARIGSDEERDFLMQELHNENDLLKLESARALARCCSNGLQWLAEKAALQPQPFEMIYNHVKQELQR